MNKDVIQRRNNAFLEISSFFKASSCLKWVFNYKKPKKKISCLMHFKELLKNLKTPVFEGISLDGAMARVARY